MLRTVAAGGRQWGLYVPTNFLCVQDICADNAGGFYIVESEGAGLRRLAHFNSSGQLVREWYGGSPWCPYACPEPDDPTAVWFSSDRHGTSQTLARAIVNLDTGDFTIHSTYQVAGLNPLIGSGANGAGNGGWVPMKHNGITYLCQQQWPTLQVLRVDSTNWRLIPVVKGFRGTDVTLQL